MQTALWRQSPATCSSTSKCRCIAVISPSRSFITSCRDAISSSMSRSMDDTDDELVIHAFASEPEHFTSIVHYFNRLSGAVEQSLDHRTCNQRDCRFDSWQALLHSNCVFVNQLIRLKMRCSYSECFSSSLTNKPKC